MTATGLPPRPNHTRAAKPKADEAVNGETDWTGELNDGSTLCRNLNSAALEIDTQGLGRECPWICTRPEGHQGQHAAGTGVGVAAVWL